MQQISQKGKLPPTERFVTLIQRITKIFSQNIYRKNFAYLKMWVLRL